MSVMGTGAAAVSWGFWGTRFTARQGQKGHRPPWALLYCAGLLWASGKVGRAPPHCSHQNSQQGRARAKGQSRVGARGQKAKQTLLNPLLPGRV